MFISYYSDRCMYCSFCTVTVMLSVHWNWILWKDLFKGLLKWHTHINTDSCLIYFWQGYLFFLHSIQRHANQISVFLQILLKFFRMFYHLSFHFSKVVSIQGERSFLWDKLTLDRCLKSLVIRRDPTSLSITQMGGALLETLFRGFSLRGMDTNCRT